MYPFTFSKTSQSPMIAMRRTAMKALVVGITSVAVLSGCQATKGVFGKVDDGSLTYKDAKKLEPMQIPAEKETAPFVPLYPTPSVGTNTLELENESGQRYQLPPPYRQVPTAKK